MGASNRSPLGRRGRLGGGRTCVCSVGRSSFETPSFETPGGGFGGAVGGFGDAVDLRPQSGGLIGLIWILPVVVMVFGFAGLASVFQRWRSTEAKTATDADVALVEELRAGARSGSAEGDA